MRKILWLFLIAIIGVGAWLTWALLMPVEPSGQKFVMLRPGFSTRRIALELKNAGVIRSEEAFILWHYYHHGRSLKAGEYLFEKPAIQIAFSIDPDRRQKQRNRARRL